MALPPASSTGRWTPFRSSFTPMIGPLVDNAVQRAMDQGAGYDIEFRTVWPNGSVHWLAGKGKVFPGDDGRPGRMIGVGMDVTQRKRAEQTARFLADASAALAALVDYESTLQKVASLAVPYFADWARWIWSKRTVAAAGGRRPTSIRPRSSWRTTCTAASRPTPRPREARGTSSAPASRRSCREITDELLVQSVKDDGTAAASCGSWV